MPDAPVAMTTTDMHDGGVGDDVGIAVAAGGAEGAVAALAS